MIDVKLSGKTAIVTGGSAGIGLACAKALYREGANVVIVGRSEDRLAAAVAAIERAAGAASGSNRVLAVAGDMVQEETVHKAVAAAIDTWGQIDVLVNSAGSARAGSIWDLPEEAFLDAWNLKLRGYIRMIRAVSPYMAEQRSGCIININGGAARTPSPMFLAGSTANAAILNFTRGVSKELARHNVRIVAISPGTTATERAERLAEQNAQAKGITVEEYKAQVLAGIPMGRMVDPDEIATMMLLLASDLVPSITGSEIMIDGGVQPGV
jgi:NAD(P)-dependent dehydrogenase (short-subunit alcohol dehydrogenase family)